MSFNVREAIKPAANSVATLRRGDVYRVLEGTPRCHRAAVAEYIARNRADLHAEIVECLDDIEDQS